MFPKAGLAVLCGCCALLMMSWAGPARAEEPPDSDRPTAAERKAQIQYACRDELGRPESWLDRTHSYFNRRLCEPAAWFDGFFGDPRAIEETPVGTFFRLRNEWFWDESDDYRFRVRLSANVSLPRASDRLRLLFSRDEDVRGDFEDIEQIEGSETRTRVGLRYLASDKQRSRLDLDTSVRLRSDGIHPLFSARHRYTKALTESTQGRLTQRLFWEERGDGLGFTSRADWEWLPDQRSLVRLSGQGTHSEESDGIDWAASTVAFRQIDHRRAARVQIGVSGNTRPDFEARKHFINFSYRRSFFRHWLFYELQPERVWLLDPETGDRPGDWRFTATLEVLFENEPVRDRRLKRNQEKDRSAP